MHIDGVSSIAVLDINHGGIKIAESLLALGFDAIAVDVYGTKKSPFSNAPVMKPEDVGQFDALVVPVHMKPDGLIKRALKENKPVFTHHRMAGMIINSTGMLDGAKSIEVTGTYGKTTTCSILSGMLMEAGEKVLLHTSKGLYFNDRMVKKKLSITPANMIEALEFAKNAGIKPTVCIFEVSLGGCGTADTGIITTLERPYLIAGNSKSSIEAKRQMIEYAKPESTLVVKSGIMIGNAKANIVTFGPGGDVYYNENGYIAYNISSHKLSGSLKPVFGEGFDITSYNEPVLCATAAALINGASPENISSMLKSFIGVEGRMVSNTIQGRKLVDNSNSGLSFAGIGMALEYARPDGGRKVLIIGEESYNVCEGLDPQKAIDVIDSAGIDSIILVGDRFKALSMPNSIKAGSLGEGIDAALRITSPGDTIISCVKTWR